MAGFVQRGMDDPEVISSVADNHCSGTLALAFPFPVCNRIYNVSSFTPSPSL